ncbi:MAG: DUF6449 domain-containing protein [Lachnospiraceae bacterium]|nr:DUF6449 domain-containing protein [Lachnospiraceae bacterium]
MTSRNWFFKLMKEDLKHRIWSIALSCLVYFFAFPIGALLIISQVRHNHMYQNMDMDSIMRLRYENQQILDQFLDYVDYNGISLFTFLILGFALLLAFNGFLYLHSSKKTDFYHNLPVRREKWFAVITTNSFLICMVPYLVFGLLASLLIIVNCGSILPIYAFFRGFLANMVYFLMIFMTAAVAIMLTGHVFVGFLATGVFFLYGPLLIAVQEALMHLFHTYYDASDRTAAKLIHVSPLFWGFNGFASGLSCVPLCRFLLFTLLWVVLLGLLALYLYRIRPSEAAGHAMSFPVTKAPIKFLIAIPVGLACGFIVDSVLYDQILWTIFGIFCGVVFTVCIMEIIYHSDFKKLFAHKIQLILCLVITFAIFGIFRLDLFGYDRYLPDEKGFAGASVCSYYLENNSSELNSTYELNVDPVTGEYLSVNWHYDTFDKSLVKMQITDYALIRALAEQGVADTKRANAKNVSETSASDPDAVYYDTLLMGFHYKNGHSVYRSYTVNFRAIPDLMEQVYRNPEYKKTTYPLLNMDPVELSGVNVETIWGQRHIAFPDEATMAQLLTTYQSELMKLTLEDRKEQLLGCLQFKSHQFQKDANAYRKAKGYLDFFTDSYFYPVYPSFKETLALLKKLDVDLYSTISAEQIASMEVTNDMIYWDDLSSYDMVEKVTYTDPARIKEILDCVTYNGYNYYPYWDNLSYNVSVEAFIDPYKDPHASPAGHSDRPLDDSPVGSMHLTFYKEVPQFVLDDLQIPDEVALEYHLK